MLMGERRPSFSIENPQSATRKPAGVPAGFRVACAVLLVQARAKRQRPTFPTGWTVTLERLERRLSTIIIDL
jgi:hypothetical protein